MTATAPANPRRPLGHQIVKSVLATLALASVLVIWPIAVLRRYREISTSNLDFQLRPEDPLLIVLSLIGLCVILAIVSSFRPLRQYGSLGQLQTAFRDVVAMSLIGHGPFFGWTYSNPDASLSELEFPVEEAAQSSTSGELQDVAAVAAAPTVYAAVAEVLQAPVETAPHVVRHRDSWWKIAEEMLDDPQRWSELRDLNLGTEVAPGVVLDEETALRSGWTIAVPTS